MGLIRVGVAGDGGPLAAALTAHLGSRPTMHVVDPATDCDVAVFVCTTPAAPAIPAGERVTLVIGPDDPNTMVTALENGALGYVPHDVSLQSMGDAVERVAAGEGVVPPHMLGSLLRHVVRRRRVDREVVERIEELTPREREIFDLAGRGHDRSSIAEELYISVGTVRSHLQSIFKKLDVHSQAELMAVAGRATGSEDGF